MDALGNIFYPLKSAYIRLFEFNKFLAVFVLSTVTTFFLFVLMVALISLGDDALEEDKSVKLADIVMPERDIDTFVDDAASRMEVVGEPKTILPVMEEVQSKVAAVGGPTQMMSIERYAFYERAKKAYAVIQTGERRFYGCFALRKGVIGPDES